MIRGLDISAIQGNVDWAAVAASGCKFTIIKCAEGNHTLADGRFAENVGGARAARLVVGCYLFPYALPGHDPIEQAEAHFKLSGGLGSQSGDLPPAVDFEWPAPQSWGHWGCSAKQLRDWALQYIARVEQLWGVVPLLYTYPSFWAHVRMGADVSEFARYPLWSASYLNAHTKDGWPPEDAKPPVVESPWSSWSCWQWSGGSKSLPHGGPVDYDVMPEGGLEQLTRREEPVNPEFVLPDIGPPVPPDEA